jgi:sulfatase maturation enzyme AslB (radical SAM superfamily)
MFKKSSSKKYWSCEWLDGGLGLQHSTISACCITHHRDRGWVRLCNGYDGVQLPILDILKAKRCIIQMNQAHDRYIECQGCSFLKEREWQQDGFPLYWLGITHYYKCNLRCYYCCFCRDELQALPHMNVLPLIRSIVDDGLVAPDAQILWGGGEPTILPEFEDIYTLLADYGVSQEVPTNGVVFSQSLEKHLKHSKTMVKMSLDAANPETYRKIKGADYCSAAWESAGKYALSGGSKVVVKIIVSEYNLEEVQQFAGKCKEFGIKKVAGDVDCTRPTTDQRIVNALARLAFSCKERGIQFSLHPIGTEAWPEMQVKDRFEEAYAKLVDGRLVSSSGRKQASWFGNVCERGLGHIKHIWNDIKTGKSIRSTHAEHL